MFVYPYLPVVAPVQLPLGYAPDHLTSNAARATRAQPPRAAEPVSRQALALEHQSRATAPALQIFSAALAEAAVAPWGRRLPAATATPRASLQD